MIPANGSNGVGEDAFVQHLDATVAHDVFETAVRCREGDLVRRSPRHHHHVPPDCIKRIGHHRRKNVDAAWQTQAGQ